jgi:hypothetical protein
VHIEEKSTLLASGLIAGEAIIGILLAILLVAGVTTLATTPFWAEWGGWPSLARKNVSGTNASLARSNR